MVPSKREVKVYLAQKTNIPYNSKRGKVLVHWIIDRIREREFESMEKAFRKSSCRLSEMTNEDARYLGIPEGGFEDNKAYDLPEQWGGSIYSMWYYSNGSIQWVHEYDY